MAVLTPELIDFDSFAVRRRLKAPTSEGQFRPAGQRFQQAERSAERSSCSAEAFELLKRYRATRYTPCC